MNPYTIVTYGFGDPQDETSAFSLGFSTFISTVSLSFTLSINQSEEFELVR